MLEVSTFSNLYHLQTTMLIDKQNRFICHNCKCIYLLSDSVNVQAVGQTSPKVLFGETSIHEIMCFLSTGTTSHWSTTKLLWHIKTTVLWSDWRKMQNFTVAVAKDYMLINKVWKTNEISYTQQWNQSKPSLNLEKTKILCYSNTKNVAAKTQNLYLNLRLSQDIYGGC